MFALATVALSVRASVRLSAKQLVQQICVNQSQASLGLSVTKDAREVVILGSVLSYTPVPGPVILRSVFLRKQGLSASGIFQVNVAFIGSAMLAGVIVVLLGTVLSAEWTLVPEGTWTSSTLILTLIVSEIASRGAVVTNLFFGMVDLVFCQALILLAATLSLNFVSSALGLRLPLGALVVTFISPAFASLTLVVPGGLGVREAMLARFGGDGLQLSGVAVVSLVERILVLVALVVAYGLSRRGRTRG